MDTEHWFAPMKRISTNSGTMMGLYLSTNQTSPFYVKIENNNKVLDSVLVSKGNPVRYDFQNLEVMQTNNRDSVNVVLSKGLHVTGPQKFFANVRFSQVNHAEIITSKGRAGKGTHFFIGYAPFKNGTTQLNYTVGIIATEDNTTVDINGQKITLNKAESYIIEGYAMDDSYIGKEITSDKPISVTNGNYNGQYASASTSSGSDILMDQSIPVERLGKEYIVMSGNGDFSDGMESALIIATVDNTQIFFNNEGSSTVTLNKGQYYMMPTTKYQFINSNTSTAYIKSSENIYVYQLLSGSGSVAAGGMNYVPPLNCYLPRKIDEIGFINYNPGYLNINGGNTFYDTHPTKLNIITQAGATVSLNGTVLNGSNGPYPVSGTTEWVTFTVADATGNAVIESNKAVTAGIAAGDNAVGYGGYFAGASSLPVITKSGTCLPGIKLEVDDTYDNYQWKIKDETTGLFVNIPGANSYSYTPTAPGQYKNEIGTLNCGIMETPVFTVLNCPVNSQQNLIICNAKTIPIAFTVSKQTVDLSKVKILTPPTKGTAIISGGNIVYTPTPGFVDNATDTFTYYFEGNSTYPDSEIVTVNITLKKLSFQNAELTACLMNGVATYNLSLANVTSDTSVTKTYYTSLADAQSNNTAMAISNVTAFSTALQKVYVNIASPFGCSEVAEISLKYFSVPNIDTSKFNGAICDQNLDGSETVLFSDITPLIVTNPADFTVNYYTITGTTPLANQFTFTGPTTINVEVKSKNGCPSVFGTINFDFKNKIGLNAVSTQEICDNDIDGSTAINLADYETLFTTAATATYYDSYTNAQNKTNAIGAAQNISSDKSFWYRFESATDCPNIGELKIHFKQPKKSTLLQDVIICSESSTVLDAGSGFDSYLWSNGATTSTSGNLTVGEYYVDLGYNGCVYRQSVKINAAPTINIQNVDVNGSTITVNVSGGTAPYQYSLDGITWQDSNIFTNISRGVRKVYVKDSYNCAVVERDFLIVNLINVITPNGDGYNDAMDYSDLRIKKDVSIQIFDRYGKAVYNAVTTNYKWDGTYLGRVVPTATYWYLIKWTEPDTNLQVVYHGWILVKNRE